MDDIVSDFELLKISAFNKIKEINDRNASSLEWKPSTSLGIIRKDNSTTHLLPNESGKEIILKENEENNLPIRHILKELEIQRRQKVDEVVQSRVNKLQEFSRKQADNRKQQWLKQQQAFIRDMQQMESSIYQVLDEYNKNTSDNHAKLLQHYQNLEERRRIREKELEAKEEERRIISVNIDNIKKHQQDFRLVYQQIIALMKSCSNNEELKNMLGEDFKLLKKLPESLDEIVANCKNGKVNTTDVHKALDNLGQVTILKSKIEECVNSINNKTKQKLDVPKKQPEKQNVVVPTNNSVLKEKNDSKIDTPREPNSVSAITQYVSLNNLKMYIETLKFLEEYTASYRELEADNSQKDFKFQCKKAVNTPVNAISKINPEHILDKFDRLYKLLSGQNVLVNERQLNASSHPQGIAFCMGLLARKFIVQGDLMVSSNPEAAFCYASVIISLWNEFPVFGKLLLGNFYKSCPYLVPYYVPRQTGESDEQFYMKQGYEYNKGEIEKQDQFLKRMTGIMRLYCAILIAKPKRGQTKTPHNIQHGWSWLVSLLKLEPRVDVTATMLHTFLETLGFEMERRYGNMFQKLMAIIVEKYLPLCREKCSGGAVARLESLMTEYFKNRKFVPPNGYVDYSFW